QLICDTKEIVKRLALFLEIKIDDNILEKVLQYSSLQAMQTDLQRWSIERSKDMPKFIRKGEIGDWHNYFNEEQSKLIDMKVEQFPLMKTLWAKMSDNNDEKSFPGTLIDPDTCEHHHHTSHHQRHPHSHHAPALVELHIHLDGSFRHSTLFELAEKKGILFLRMNLATIEDFIPYVSVQSTCQSLAEFLEKFPFFLNIVAGDVEALERVAYEFVEDQAIQGVLYTEARYSPQVLMGNTLTPEQVIVAINRGFKRGIKEFHVDIRTLLCCIRPHPEWSMEVVDLANKYRSAGVVGIDLAGSEHNCSYSPHAAAFERAVKLGIHRTVHAGETGSADSVLQAIQQCHAERIGHGYAIVDDPAIYEIVHSRDIHLECCLTSSLHTNAVGKYMPTDIEKYEEHFMLHGHKTKTTLHMHAKSKKEVWHPIHHFARDHINFSLSCDDPSVSQITIEHEYEHALTDLKLSPAQLSQCVFNAARSSFLPENEKNQLIDRLLANYLPKQVMTRQLADKIKDA
ncbi:unnamed protein product, partial [Rotaria socialis]